MRLLLVEDDAQIVDGLRRALHGAGHSVEAVNDGYTADLRLATEDYDLVILDLGLPGLSGHEVLRKLRARGKQTPAIILSARDDQSDRIRSLDAGADDYVSKPFDLAELEARIRAIARRALGRSGGDVTVGTLRLRLSERMVYIGEQPIELSPREFGVLECLILRHGRVVSKAQLQEHVGGWESELTEGAIEIYIHRLRKKIEHADVEIRTVRGFGYLLRSVDN